MDEQLLRRFNVQTWGHRQRADDPVVVLAHGFGCDQRVWRFIAPGLAETHQVLAYDLMGSGRSDTRHWRAERYLGLQDHARDLLDILDALGAGPVVLAGHSASSSIAMLAAIQRPQSFQRLVLVAPNPCFVNDPPDYIGGFDQQDVDELLDMMDRNMVGWAQFFAPVAMKNEDRPHLQDELARSICQGDPVIVRRFARQVFASDLRDVLPQVSVASLLLQCRDDAVAPDHVGAYMQQRMPQAHLLRLRATGHCPHMSHPEEVLAVLREDMPNWAPLADAAARGVGAM